MPIDPVHPVGEPPPLLRSGDHLKSGLTGHRDVAIFGAGIGGLTAAILLRQAGFDVVTIEPEPFPHDRLGESLDWAVPGLLRGLGISPDDLLRDEVATRKIGIDVIPAAEPQWSGRPKAWFQRWPLKFELVTLNSFRPELDQRLFERACDVGVQFVWSRVVRVTTERGRVTSCATSAGDRISANWFIDASGQAQVLARALGLGRREYGERKVCTWAWYDDSQRPETTMFYGENVAGYLTWIWEIPITPTRVSVGCVMPAERFRTARATGASVAAIFRDELAKHDRFADVLLAQPEVALRTCSWRTYVVQKACGPNWFLVGEAGSLPDPLTANGVTAAMRHAHHAVRCIRAAKSSTVSALQRRLYDWHVRAMGDIFNYCIETAVYRPRMRCGLGPRAAQRVYTTFSYLINALYSRLRPRGPLGIALFFGLLLAVVRIYMESWSLAARIRLRFSRV